MKILAVNGSPRKGGNTSQMLNEVLGVCKDAGFETEVYQAGGKVVKGCLGCGSCRGVHPGRCVQDDWINELYPKMKAADAIVLGSPTYFSDITPEMKAVMDRCGYMAGGEDKAFSRKVGAGVSVARRAGAINSVDSMQHFLLINDMILPGSRYWNMSLGAAPGDFQKDEEGIAIMRRLGENIVWLLNKIHA